MPEMRQHAIQADGATLHVLDEGAEGLPCVVLAHSVMASARMWIPQVAQLRSLGFRVIRPDSRGHGGSQCDAGPLSIDQLAADVVRILDALQIGSAHFVGLSLGGMVGFALGQQHAARVLSTVICDARADAPPAFAQPWDGRIAQARDRGMASLVQPTLERWFGDRLAKLDAAWQANLREDMGSTSVAGFIATARALQAFDYTSALASMPRGSTLIVGELDGGLPDAMAALAARMPACALEVIASAGHLPNLEEPALFNEALQRHFQRTAQ